MKRLVNYEILIGPLFSERILRDLGEQRNDDTGGLARL
jgi:hypothetical protein